MEKESRPSVALWIMFVVCIGLIVFIYFYLNNKITANLVRKEYGNINADSFNKYIDIVEGEVEGGSVKLLCNRLVENAETFKDVEKLLPDVECVNVEMANDDSTYEKETDEDTYAITLYDYDKYESEVGIIESNILSEDKYTVSYEYDDNGYISKVIITGSEDNKKTTKTTTKSKTTSKETTTTDVEDDEEESKKTNVSVNVEEEDNITENKVEETEDTEENVENQVEDEE